jgi:hypothetical protein
MTMASCGLCGKKDKSSLRFCGSSVCQNCYGRLGLDKLEGNVPPEDEYLTSRIDPKEMGCLEGLNLMATLLPKALAWDLLDTASEGFDEGVERIVLHAQIISARAVSLFGKGKQRPEEVYAASLAALMVFGSSVAAALVSRIASEKPSGENDELDELEGDLDVLSLEMLRELKSKDDGLLAETLDELIEALGAGTDAA